MISIFLHLTLIIKVTSSGDVPQPFRILWNYPDIPCRNLNIDFGLERFNIEYNEHAFEGEKVACFYSNRAGKWPYINFRNRSTWVNGGLPTGVDMPAHLAALKEAIRDKINPDANGFGVLDMENWRPVLRTNYGGHTPYQRIFAYWVRQRNPGISRQLGRRLARQMWKEHAEGLMITSLEAAREVVPNEKWGYYGYPELVTKTTNYRLTGLWNAINGYYPSIYIKNFDDPEAKRDRLVRTVAESFRVRAEYGNPDDPIMPYTLVQSVRLGFFNETWLSLAVRLPLELGVDGLILWASYREFRPPREKCAAELQFVTNTLGPLLLNEMNRMTNCSQQLCTARGRCVLKEYLERIPYLQSRGVPEDILSTAQPSGIEAMSMDRVDNEFKDDFVCQCYNNAAGDRCTDAYVHR